MSPDLNDREKTTETGTEFPPGQTEQQEDTPRPDARPIADRLLRNLEDDPRLGSGAPDNRAIAHLDFVKAYSLAASSIDSSRHMAAPFPEETDESAVGASLTLDEEPSAPETARQSDTPIPPPSPRASLAKLDDLLARLQQDETELSADANEAPLERLEAELEPGAPPVAAPPALAPRRPLPDELTEVDQLLHDLENQPRDIPRGQARHKPPRHATGSSKARRMAYWLLIALFICSITTISYYIYIILL